MEITKEFKEHASKKVVKNLLANIDTIVEKEHVDNEEDLVDDNFDFLTTLELEAIGYYLTVHLILVTQIAMEHP